MRVKQANIKVNGTMMKSHDNAIKPITARNARRLEKKRNKYSPLAQR